MPSPGERIDRYELLHEIGAGGQAEVWRVRDPLAPGAARVVKLFSMNRASEASAERIRREARLLASLDHPGLLHCHALFEDLDKKTIGFVLDYVDGPTLADARSDRRWTVTHARIVLARVAECLAFVHDRGVVHRDLKPDNILLGARFFDDPRDPSQVRLIDLGIAVDQDNQKPLTREGTVIGTLPYIAPEVIAPHRFEGSRSAPAVDVFALGVLAWEILVGGHPTGLGLSATAIQLATHYAASAGRSSWGKSSAPEPWGRVLPACLALDPAERIPDARRLARLLVASEGPLSVPPESPHLGPLGTVEQRPSFSPPLLMTRISEPATKTQPTPLTPPVRTPATLRDPVLRKPIFVLLMGFFAAFFGLGLIVLVVRSVSGDDTSEQPEPIAFQPRPPQTVTLLGGGSDTPPLRVEPGHPCHYVSAPEGLAEGEDRVDTSLQWTLLRADLRLDGESATDLAVHWSLFINGAPRGLLGAEEAALAPRVVLDDLRVSPVPRLRFQALDLSAAPIECTPRLPEPIGPDALVRGLCLPCVTKRGVTYKLCSCLSGPVSP